MIEHKRYRANVLFQIKRKHIVSDTLKDHRYNITPNIENLHYTRFHKPDKPRH